MIIIVLQYNLIVNLHKSLSDRNAIGVHTYFYKYNSRLKKNSLTECGEIYLNALVLLLSDRNSDWLTKVRPLNLNVKLCSVETANLHRYIGKLYRRLFSMYPRNVSHRVSRDPHSETSIELIFDLETIAFLGRVIP